MSKESNSRRLLILVVVVGVVGAVFAWRMFGTRAQQPESAAADKAEELSERYEAAGGSTQTDDEGAEVPESLEERGPQSVDD